MEVAQMMVVVCYDDLELHSQQTQLLIKDSNGVILNVVNGIG